MYVLRMISTHSAQLTPVIRDCVRTICFLVLVTGVLSFSSGCDSSQGPSAIVISPAAIQSPTPSNSSLQSSYIVDPEAARLMRYRIDWQSDSLTTSGSHLEQMVVHGDSVFGLDDKNFLTRLRAEDGDRVWRVAVSSPLSEIIGLTYLPDRNQIYLTTGSELLVHDTVTGALVGKQKLDTIANTTPVPYDQYMIYGSRNGQVVWHSYAVHFQWKAYQVDETITIPPMVYGPYILAVGNRGRFMVLNAIDGSQQWSKALGDSVSAPPAVSAEGIVFVAGEDQYLHAFDLDSGHVLWERLFEHPLNQSPTLIGDAVYQQVPGSGLLCLDALPIGSPNGQIHWQSPETIGNVFMQHGDALFTWDADSGLLNTLSAVRGTVRESISLPGISRLITTSTSSGDLYAMSRSGRIIKLVPRNPRNSQ